MDFVLDLSPQHRDDPARPALERRGDALVIDGVAYDLADLAPGGSREIDSPWAAGPALREGEVVRVSLVLSHADDAPRATLWPAPLIVAGDGPIDLPPFAGAPDPTEG